MDLWNTINDNDYDYYYDYGSNLVISNSLISMTPQTGYLLFLPEDGR